jgi:hypothetical protein
MAKGNNLEVRMERPEVVFWSIQSDVNSWRCVMVFEIDLWLKKE